MLALADDAALARLANSPPPASAHVDAVNGCRPPRNSRLLSLSCTGCVRSTALPKRNAIPMRR